MSTILTSATPLPQTTPSTDSAKFEHSVEIIQHAPTWQMHCFGTIIGERHVLTAATCTLNFLKYGISNMEVVYKDKSYKVKNVKHSPHCTDAPDSCETEVAVVEVSITKSNKKFKVVINNTKYSNRD